MNVSRVSSASSGPAAPEHPSPADYGHPLPWDTEFEAIALPELLERTAARSPHAHCVDFLGRRYSYVQLLNEARHFASGLQAMGIAKGDRVGLFLPNVPIYVSTYYGAMMAGATVVNFSPLYTADELCAQVEDSGTRLLVTVDVAALLPTAIEVIDKSSLERLVVGRLADMLPVSKGLALRAFGRSQTATVPDRGDVRLWGDCLQNRDPKPVSIDPETDLAVLQYTGGTTGVPKGGMLTHANLSINAQQVQALDPFPEERDMIMGVLPLFHVFANTCVLNRTVLKGGCIAMLPRFDAKQALKTIDRVRPTAFPGVPTMYQALLDNPRITKTDFSSLLICISGGAPLPAPVRDRFEEVSGARLVEGYGLTESSGVVSVNPYEGLRKPGTIGQPLMQTRLRLRDKEDATKPAPSGEPGEIVIRGPQVMKGYWNRPDMQASAFVEIDGEEWLRTGDVATIDEQGFARIVDRTKDMISVGGFKVFPSQIEDVLVENPAVKEALVIGVPDDYRGEMPKAFVTLQADAEASEEALAEWLNGRIGKHERVKGVAIRSELPKTMIGKLDRKALREQEL
ncbi:long-chain fatty acid--CoA ligase [Altererythrobacter sp. SALINAS58]|uniref:long-chain-fatty-acid--CoA ligase n=1 Tax=Alteripontixanthobacter muriae TaxID=2705546 RepID=UPI001575A930|nr:long-chain fatty acid--CoA ligase [Alteripontixanthobacter muriae]NTZ43496.1 long-chain fatty acid--CoA ligase [Alteripontixanthobacter muriae]